MFSKLQHIFFNYVVSDSSTELKIKKVSSSRANYSIMFVKSLLMPFQFFNLLNFKLKNMYHSTSVVVQISLLDETKHNVAPAGSQYDASLALRPLRCDEILKTDWSNTMQLTQK